MEAGNETLGVQSTYKVLSEDEDEDKDDGDEIILRSFPSKQLRRGSNCSARGYVLILLSCYELVFPEGV